jgi:hypothetical protein
MQADAAWFLANHLASTADQDTYLANIKAAGFNSFILMNIVHNEGGDPWPVVKEPNDANGNAPFLTADQLDTQNPIYVANVKRVVDKALELGLAVFLFPTYVGYNGGVQGWEATITNAHNTDSICFNWGVFLAHTFNEPNVIPMWMGDHTLSGVALSRMQQIVAGWRSISRTQLAGSELDGPDSLATTQTGFTYGTDPATSDMQIDSFYGNGLSASGVTWDTADRAWANSPKLPATLEEPVYEFASYNANNTRAQVRAAQHWAITSGAIAGSNAGFNGSWQMVPVGSQATITPNANWKDSFSSPARADQTKAFALYSSLSWWLMRPSGTAMDYCGRTLIVSGVGSGSNKITSSMSSDGNQLLAYVPPTGSSKTTFSVDFRSLSAGSKSARWWNPTTGTYSDATPSTVTNALSSQSFTTPGDNGTGQNDWMLVVR